MQLIHISVVLINLWSFELVMLKADGSEITRAPSETSQPISIHLMEVVPAHSDDSFLHLNINCPTQQPHRPSCRSPQSPLGHLPGSVPARNCHRCAPLRPPCRPATTPRRPHRATNHHSEEQAATGTPRPSQTSRSTGTLVVKFRPRSSSTSWLDLWVRLLLLVQRRLCKVRIPHQPLEGSLWLASTTMVLTLALILVEDSVNDSN